MTIQYDPRLQGKQNTTDILSGQEGASQAQEQPQSDPNAPAQPSPQSQPQQAPQSNIATKKPSSSGMFTNVAQYLQKNQPAAQKMAESIGDTVQRSADIARKNIQASQKQFGNLMEQGSLQNRESAVQDVRSAAEQAASMTAPQQQMQITGATQQTGEQRTGGPAQQVVQPVGQESSQQQSQEMSDSDRRIQSILDAAYKGPQRLQELGSFGQAQRKAQEAQRLTEQLTGGNRQELLDRSLERQGSNYTQGARRLDELLFGQGEPQEYLQQRQQQIGDISRDLTGATSQARQMASQRQRELSDIRSQARQQLQDIASGRASDVEDFLAGQESAGQDLVKYYQDVIGGQEGGGLDLGTLEARTLGVQSGAGLYNLLRDEAQREQVLSDLDASGQLDRSKLISRDQQAQLAELQRLAQLSGDYGVADSGLDFRSQYQDPSQAGTQSALDALNLGKFGDYLTEAEKNFRTQAAQDVTGVGYGQARYSRGAGRGRGKVKRWDTQSANLKDLMQDAGYDFESDPSQYIGEVDTSVLQDLSTIASKARGENIDISDPQGMVDTLAGLGGEDSILYDNEIARSLGLGQLGKIATAGGLSQTVGDTYSGLGEGLSGIRDFEKMVGAENSVIGDILAAPGNVMRELGSAISSAGSSIWGGGKGRAKREARAEARAGALRDLQNKLTGKLSSSGFANRLNVADTEASQERARNLLDILGRIES